MNARIAIMKLEIDLTDFRQLTKAKAELTRLSSIIDFALLQQTTSNRSDNLTENSNNGTLFPAEPQTREAFKPILDIIASLPHQFTTTDVIIGLGENGERAASDCKSGDCRCASA